MATFRHIYTILAAAAALLVCSSYGYNLDVIDQQLDALTSRMLSLSERLDALQEDNEAGTFAVKRLVRTLDDVEGRLHSAPKW